LFSGLPLEVQADAKRAYRLFQNDPAHPSLHFKKVVDEDVYSVRIGLGYRALGVLRKNRVVWFWIGGHAEYNRLV
jgi:hypothetical protein